MKTGQGVDASMSASTAAIAPAKVAEAEPPAGAAAATAVRRAAPAAALQASDFHDRGACPLCSSSGLVVHMNFPDLPVIQCTQCRFMYAKAILSAAALERYYALGFGGLRHQRGQAVNAGVNAHMLGRLIHPKPGMSMLDVGAGYGYLLRQMQARYGVVGTGVEPSRQEAEFARSELGVNVIGQMLDRAALPAASFDLVASFEVIEHVPQPLAFLQELLSYVKPGGLLVVMTDNFGSSAVKALGAGFPKWIPHTHISHFAADTLAAAAQRLAGVQIENTMSFTPWEFQARRLAVGLGLGGQGPGAGYNLQQALATEMGGQYRFFGLRRWLNVAWAGLTARPGLDGAVMYLACRKAAT